MKQSKRSWNHKKIGDKSNFKPSREYLKRATEEFLKKGGKIRNVTINYDSEFTDGRTEVDKFLMGL